MKKSIILMTTLIACGAQAMQPSSKAQQLLDKANASLKKAYNKAKSTLGVDISNASGNILKVSDYTGIPSTIKPGDTKWVAVPARGTFTIKILTPQGSPVLDQNSKPLATKIRRDTNIGAYEIQTSTVPACTSRGFSYQQSTGNAGIGNIRGICVKPITIKELDTMTQKR